MTNWICFLVLLLSRSVFNPVSGINFRYLNGFNQFSFSRNVRFHLHPPRPPAIAKVVSVANKPFERESYFTWYRRAGNSSASNPIIAAQSDLIECNWRCARLSCTQYSSERYLLYSLPEINIFSNDGRHPLIPSSTRLLPLFACLFLWFAPFIVYASMALCMRMLW